MSESMRTRSLRLRPQCEALEDRLTPAVTIKLDYTYDAAGLFNDPAARAALQRAADAVTARITDSLTAINPDPQSGNSWTAQVYDSASGKTLSFANPTINKDEIVVFITSGNLGGALAMASNGGYSAQGNNDWFTTIQGRGENTANGNDYAPWGGLIAFNSSTNFSFDGTPTSAEYDFQSVATHEMLHIFGFESGNPSFARYSKGGVFTGPKTDSVYGGTPGLDASASHFATGVSLNGKESLMSPSISPGLVKGMTELEYAALADIGWDESTVSVPPPPVIVTVPPPPVVVPPTVPPVIVKVPPPPVVPPTVPVPPVVVTVPPPPVVVPPVSVPPTVPPAINYAGPVTLLGNGTGGLPSYTVLGANGQLITTGLAYSPTFRGGVRTAVGDVNGDGVEDYIFGAGAGSAPHVKVMDGKTGKILYSFFAYDSTERGGIYVAAGDINGDGKADIAVSLGTGAIRARVFSGANGQLLADLTGIGDANFTGGAQVALGDINGDGAADLVLTPGAGTVSTVSIWDGDSLAVGKPARLAGDFLAFDTSFTGGASLAVGDIDGDGFGDVIAGAGAGNANIVRVYSGKSLLANSPKILTQFLSGDANSKSGVRLAAFDMNSDGRDDVIVAPGNKSDGVVRTYSGQTVLKSASPTTMKTSYATDWASYGAYVG